MARIRIRYAGRVQGVGFRATAAHIAGGFDVTGWVRNQADGAVLLEVQGNAGEVAGFREALRQRMRRNIEREDAEDAPEAGDEAGFEIRQ
ncbi:MAG: acylphosphatase [Phycisphaeraceae bacterium]|nr:acylphosphatase [Phycisphaeraceae bacterium]